MFILVVVGYRVFSKYKFTTLFTPSPDGIADTASSVF